MRQLVLGLVSVAACGGGGGGGAKPDAKVRGDAGADAARATDAALDSRPIDAPAACAPAVVYLNFDGVEIVKGFDDATLNHAGWMDASHADVVVAPWQANAGDRQARISAIVAQIAMTFAPYDITLLTARPATGPYDMIVFGGDPAAFGYASTTRGTFLVDCSGHDTLSNLSVAFDGTAQTDVTRANFAILAVSNSHGLAFTTTTGDCLTSETTAPCTLSTSAVVTDQYKLGCNKPNLTTQDDNAALLAAVCAHP